MKETQKDLISVIVPVYNVEKYLKQCICSITSQSYDNLEIILVDDGSTDQSGKICDDCAKTDKRIKVIHKKNGGPSSARNVALDVCKGEYIAFVDSDDWVDQDYIKQLYEAIKINNCDLCISGYYNVYDRDGIKKTMEIYDKLNQVCCKEEYQNLFFGKHIVENYIAMMLCHRGVFDDLRFPEGMLYEDAYVITDICSRVKKGIVVVQEPLYYYYKGRPDNITNNVSEKVFDLIKARKKNIADLKEGTLSYKYGYKRLFDAYIWIFYLARGKVNKKIRNKVLKMFQKDYDESKKLIPPDFRLKFYLFRYFRPVFSIMKKFKGN